LGLSKSVERERQGYEAPETGAAKPKQRSEIMRVMGINKATAITEAGVMPSQELLAGMGALMQEMVEAGVLLGGEGLKSSKYGVRISGTGGEVVTDGPFAETKELIAGFAIMNVTSMDEAIEWGRRMIEVIERADPQQAGTVELELRPLAEPDDFGEEFTPELREAEEQLKERIGQAY
jgi:hypothetical protein